MGYSVYSRGSLGDTLGVTWVVITQFYRILATLTKGALRSTPGLLAVLAG